MMPPSFARARASLRSVGIGQGRCPGGEVLEVPAAFIQALTLELVHGQCIGLLFGGRGHSLPI